MPAVQFKMLWKGSGRDFIEERSLPQFFQVFEFSLLQNQIHLLTTSQSQFIL